MRNLMILLKKDFTMDKRYLLVITILSIGLPIYVSYTLRDIGIEKGSDFVSLFLSSVYCFFMALSKLGLIEHKYRGIAYLLLTPISRKDIVLSKYVFSFVLFFACLAGYEVSHLTISFVQPISFIAIVIAWTINIVILSLYIPLELKFGYESVKYIFTAIIVLSPLLIGFIGKYCGVSVFDNLIELVGDISVFMIVFSFLLVASSYYISIQIYKKKDM